jgi:O-antigen ligase
MLSAVLCLLVILLMESRYGVVGFFLVSSVTGLYYLKLKTKYFKIGILLFVLLGAVGLLALNSKDSNLVNDDTRSVYRRIAVSYIQNHLWWGSGFDQERLVLEQQAEKIKDTLPQNVYPHNAHPITHVHNQYLGSMVQFGVWGLAVLIAMLVAIACYAVKNRSYLLLTLLCFFGFFMWIEEGEYVKFLIFLVFFTALSEAEKNVGKQSVELLLRK